MVIPSARASGCCWVAALFLPTTPQFATPRTPSSALQGTLAALDSKNPVMYLDFPQGRYKLFGGYFNRCRLRNVLCLLPCCGGSR